MKKVMIVLTITQLLNMGAIAQVNKNYIENKLWNDSVNGSYKLIRQYQRCMALSLKNIFTKSGKPSRLSFLKKDKNSIRLFMLQGFEDTVDVLVDGNMRFSRVLKKDLNGELYNNIFDLDSLFWNRHEYLISMKFRHSKLFLQFELNRKHDFVTLYIRNNVDVININHMYYRRRFPIVSM